MRIAEIFYSLQGEGLYSGVPSVFIRTSGCNLRCQWCDTRYASWEPEGGMNSLPEILNAVQAWPQAKHVVITGGEPFIFPELVPLIQSLKRMRKVVTVETSGTVYRATEADLISLAPKLASSTPSEIEFPEWSKKHERLRINENALIEFIRHAKDVQFKFVLQGEKDWPEVESLLKQIAFQDREKIYLMPECQSKEDLERLTPWLTQWCLQKGFRFTDRMHIRFWGTGKGV